MQCTFLFQNESPIHLCCSANILVPNTQSRTLGAKGGHIFLTYAKCMAFIFKCKSHVMDTKCKFCPLLFPCTCTFGEKCTVNTYGGKMQALQILTICYIVFVCKFGAKYSPCTIQCKIQAVHSFGAKSRLCILLIHA